MLTAQLAIFFRSPMQSRTSADIWVQPATAVSKPLPVDAG
jgi:hypothetical protein